MRYLLAACLVILLAGPLAAQPCDVSLGGYMERLLENAAISHTGTLRGQDAARFVRAFNETEPRSTYQADEILIIAHAIYSHQTGFVMVHRGCVVFAGVVPNEVFDILRSGAHSIRLDSGGGNRV